MPQRNNQAQWYYLGPLLLRSDLALPLIPSQKCQNPAVIVTRTTCLPPRPTTVYSEPFVDWIDQVAWINFNGTCRAYISHGRKVQFLATELSCPTTPDDNVVYSLALSVLLLQRGMGLLHGSATERNGAARVYVGKSGAGKSTAALYDTLFGSTLLADDITPIFCDEGGTLCTFAFESESAVTALPGPEVAWIHKKAHGTTGRRLDGKTTISAGSNLGHIAKVYPVRELVFLGEEENLAPDRGGCNTLMRVLNNLAATSISRLMLGANHMNLFAKLISQVDILDGCEVQRRMRHMTSEGSSCIPNPQYDLKSA